MKQVVRKLKNDRRGFTLVELLVVVLVLLLVTSVIVGGLPAAQRAYYSVTDKADAQLLLSTASTRLRDELGTASGIWVVPASGTITYRDSDGVRTQIYPGSDWIYFRYPDLVTENAQPFVTDTVREDGLYITYGSVSFDRGVLTIYDLAVGKDGVVLADMPVLCIRAAAS